MNFKVGDIVKLTKFGWRSSFPERENVKPGALAIVKYITSDNEACACEFFPPCESSYLHDCGGRCEPHRGRWMYKREIEHAALPISANIAELFKEV